ncbi:MAG: hypothetical protein HOL51_25865 [Gemmatimonadetes bacterium]|nr:hypothetical protein [Gemmatimonadota bacterium]MBT7420519.1 hypothetical protein [Gemmatimonadota bacterium]
MKTMNFTHYILPERDGLRPMREDRPELAAALAALVHSHCFEQIVALAAVK